VQVDVKSSGKSALQVASHQGYLDIVQLLLKTGANLQLPDEDGDTALHYSAFGYRNLRSSAVLLYCNIVVFFPLLSKTYI